MNERPFEFEKALKELEDITGWFESADVDLDAGLAKFERGMELAAGLKNHLAQVENRVEKIRARFSDIKPAPTSADLDVQAAGPSEDSATTDQTDIFGA